MVLVKIMTKALTVCTTILALASGLHAQSTDGTPRDHSVIDHSAHMKMMVDAQRQAEVSKRGKDVMPFSLDATTHIFSKRSNGGTQQVVAKNSKDKAQVILVWRNIKTQTLIVTTQKANGNAQMAYR